jgi:thiol:disulfide interchange protein DsbA
MKKLLSLGVLLLLTLFPFVAMAEFEEGHEYRVLYNQPPVEKDAPLEVVEFFWYGCPHCFKFEPYLKDWVAKKPADVNLVKVPAAFHEQAKFHAYVYYALELIGEAERMQDIIFEAMHKNGNKLKDQAAVEKLLEEHKVDIATFRKAMKAWHVDSKVKRAIALFDKSQLKGVPAIAVNGRFTSGDVKNYQELVDVIDHMIGLVREEQTQQ